MNIYPMDSHNEKLLDNVHPKNRINPTPAPMYNLVIIGAGSAGLVSAAIAAALGAKVALIEENLMGGDCLNVGCVPSKCLIRTAKLAAEMQDGPKFGLSSRQVQSEEFSNVMQELRSIRAHISPVDSVERFTKLGVDVFLGRGIFTAEHKISVGEHTLNFRKAVIATGAKAVKLPIDGLNNDDEDILTNETVFNLTSLPEHILFMGGGPIGCELAQAFRRLGAEVSIIQKGAFLPREDKDASAILEKVFAEEGIKVHLDSSITKVEKLENGKNRAHIKDAAGQEFSIDVDKIFMGLGRAPNVEGLGLENVGVEFDKFKGIKVDDNLRTTNPYIFAAGDCAMALKFTHAADIAAQIVIQNALFWGRKKLSKQIIPWCTYTEPEIAHVGLYEHEAKAMGMDVDFYKYDMDDNDRALADREALGFVKVMTKKKSGKILGATIVSAHAGDMISEITTAMNAGLGLGKLATVIHPYPTQSSAIQKVAQLYNKTKLTPLVAKILKLIVNYQLKKEPKPKK